MNTGLIIKREYLTRVKSKQFLITTLLVPILLVATIGIFAYISATSKSEKNIAVVDQSQLFVDKLTPAKGITYHYTSSSVDSIKANFEALKYDGLLIIPPININDSSKNNINIWGLKQIGMNTQNLIEKDMNSIIEAKRMEVAGINAATLDHIKQASIALTQQIGEDNKESDNRIANGIAYACGFLLYMLMIIYGMSVMKSVMEEKTNRIAEIIISSVKPFELMMGKIVGVALVGLTQFLLWVVLIGVVAVIAFNALNLGDVLSNPEVMKQIAEAQESQMAMGGMSFDADTVNMFQTIVNINWFKILGWFLFYFLGGYFLYASLFAAVGSLINDESSDSNSLTLPITMPIIIAFVMMIKTLDDPSSGIAVFGSIFPLTSPIVMMARIPFNAPTWWEMLASVLCMVLGFLGTTWLAAKIYRTGILLNGKKITLKEVGKWITRRG